ncbi:MAG: acyl carrier protein [Candidatus Nanopelagicales bacterium]|jgi:acyl carrier protein|nr:acyl carrier protein [Candidatus Nanopelagicales bacterium]
MSEDILAGLAAIVNEVAGVPAEDVQPDKSFVDDLDVDSLSMVEVVMACEDKWGVKIPDSEVKNLKTVGDAVTYISAHV